MENKVGHTKGCPHNCDACVAYKINGYSKDNPIQMCCYYCGYYVHVNIPENTISCYICHKSSNYDFKKHMWYKIRNPYGKDMILKIL